MQIRLPACLLLAALLSSCATGYHSANNPILGITGGYWDQPGPGSTIKVGFSGNGYISASKVGTYLLYRCAEVAKREGGSHFVLYQNLVDAIADKRSTERTVNTGMDGKPATFAYIWIVPASEPDALNVDDLITRLGPTVNPATQNVQSKEGAQ